MHLFKNQKIRFFVIFIFGILQVISVNVSKPYADHLFYALNLSYFILGFLSLDWRQSIKNISWATVAEVMHILFIFITIVFMRIFLNGMNESLQSIGTLLAAPLMVWGLVLFVGLPFFISGLGLRYLIIFILKRKSVKA